ncbi:MAG TPA: hypothetical protein VM686_10095 [Polyangiaceae bacterium]|jgi:hypothetical protein|nr:hypothetical protein [Polyangiaceae bacterium]
MHEDEVEEWTRRELAAFRYEPPAGTIGIPWSSERVDAELETLRSSLVRPERVTVEFLEPTPTRRVLWRVTRDLANGYFVALDPESRQFGLVVHGEPSQDAGVWGDLVGTFMAR